MDETPGQVLVSAWIESLSDHMDHRRGRLDGSKVRRVEVPDARVDARVSGLLMPMWMITQLGLERVRLRTYRGVVLTILGRDCVMDVSGIADHLPVSVGRLPLLAMDWVVDTQGRGLIGNPQHDGEEMLDIFWSDAPRFRLSL